VINLVDNNIQISDKDNVLNSSQPFSSANIPIHTDDLGIILSDVKAIREVKFSATSDSSTTSSLIPSSSSSSLSLTDDSFENDLESSYSDFSPLLSDSEHREIEEFILNREDDDIKDITSKMMKYALVLGLNSNNINDNKEHNISEESSNNNSKKPTGDVFEESPEESEPFIEPYADLLKVIEEG
jgi:hypothetical protein